MFKVPLEHRCFQIGCLFAKCDLFKPATYIQNKKYISNTFNTVYINFSRQEHQIEMLIFQAIPPFIFSLQSL